MKKSSFRWMAWLLPINAALLVFAAGCKTGDEQSFNQNFNQDYPVAPKYVIENVNDDRFKIRMHQGSPMTGPSRITYLKDATTIVAENECRKRGWKNWKTDYIQETDQGWMHVLMAEVTREKAVEMAPENTSK